MSTGSRQLGGSAALLLALGATAHAQPTQSTPVAFLGMTSDEGDDAQAADVEAVLEREANAVSDWRVRRSPASIEQLTMANDCEASEPECRVRMSSGWKAELALYGVVRAAAPDTARVQLYLFRTSDGAIEGEASAELVTRDGKRLDRGAHRLMAALLGREPEPEREPEREPAARPTPPFAKRPAAPLEPAQRPVRPRKARAALVADDFEPREDRPEDDDGGAGPAIGYGLLGLSAVSAGLTVFSWVQIDGAMHHEDFVAYQRAIYDARIETDDVCVEADADRGYGLTTTQLDAVRKQCDRGKTFSVLQYVFLGSTVLSAGLGTYLVLAGGDSGEREQAKSRSRLALLPSVGSERAKLELRVRF